MGMLLGNTRGSEFVIVDVFSLPIVGTETRVNAQEGGYEYIVEHQRQSALLGLSERIVGWYHSHPGHGCWLSRIDVETQRMNQLHQDPFLSIVVSTQFQPIRSIL